MLNAQVVGGLVRTLLSSKFDQATETPDFHKEAWELCCSNNPMVAIAAPRGHAKTTGITVSYGLATLLFRERKFMLLVSDTEAQAMMFLGFFKEHLQDNQPLIELFGLKKNEKGQVQFIKDTESDIIVEFEDGHKFRIIAKGAEQKLRGLIWNGTRPDIILCDDFENDELVMSKERREKMRRWFYSALLPCRSANGIVRMVGTILHMDSLLERHMPKPWGKQTVNTPLKMYSTQRLGGWVSVKYRAHDADFKHVLWPSRWPVSKLIFERENYIAQGIPDAYSQEYLNIPLDESVAYFKRSDFNAIPKELQDVKLNYYLTVDLAISEAEKADYSVFIVAGIDEAKKILVKDVIRARMDAREIVDLLIRLQRIYNFEAVGIEEMQVSKAIGPFLREEMIRTQVFLNIIMMKHKGKDKVTRARSIQARVRAGTVYCDKSKEWYQTFEDELTRFPRDAHDDQVDAFAYLGLLLDMLIEAPTKEEEEDDEYYEELERSGTNFNGRSRITGY